MKTTAPKPQNPIKLAPYLETVNKVAICIVRLKITDITCVFYLYKKTENIHKSLKKLRRLWWGGCTNQKYIHEIKG